MGKNRSMPFIYISLLISTLTFSKSTFFVSISNGTSEEVATMVKTLENAAQSNERDAYLGAIKMKRAGQLKSLSDKSKMFKAGKDLLETAISLDHTNVEYRFLRLIIQENAPAILGYSDCISADAKKVKAGYKTLPESVKNAVIDYAKTSNNLDL
jgi:hypothetical protein